MPNNNKHPVKLRDYLGNGLSEKIDTIADFVSGLWAGADPLHPWFTLHGPQHSEQVEELAGLVLGAEHPDHIPLDKLLKDQQLFLLLAAVWLHDVGMIVPPAQAERDAAARLNIEIADWIRRGHHERSAKYVVSNAAKLGLDTFQAGVVGRLCLGHREVDLFDDQLFPEAYPNQRFLAAVLRLADELDITSARAPEQLMALKWKDMDDVGRWHWLRHWCIPTMVHHHNLTKDDNPPILRLAFEVAIRLPDPRFTSPFREEIMRPIRRTLINERVDVILRAKQLGMDVAGFKCNPQYTNQEFEDGVFLQDCFEAALLPRLRMSSAVHELLRKVANRHGDAAGALLSRQCERMLLAASRVVDVAAQMNDALENFFSAIADSETSTLVQTARAEFLQTLLRLQDQRPHELGGTTRFEEGPWHEVSSEWRSTANLGWRLTALMLGDQAQRLSQLTHLFGWLGPGASDLASWVVMNDVDPELRITAMHKLHQFAKDRLVSCFDVALRASRDSEPRVRALAAQALAYLRGPRARLRLSEMVEGDIDDLVRASANESLTTLARRRPDESMLLAGKHVAIIDNDQYFISSVVDALRERGCDTIVCIDFESARDVLTLRLPDVLLCELLEPAGPDATTTAGIGESLGALVARFIRDEMNARTPIVATGTYAPERVAGFLVPLAAVYVEKPCTVDRLMRTIESVLSAGSP